MHTTRRDSRNDSHRAAWNALIIGGDHFGLAVAEYLTESAQSVTFVSETNPTGVTDGVKPIHHELSSANDIRTLISEIADVGLAVVTGSDSETLLSGYLVRREPDPCDVVANISNSGRRFGPQRHWRELFDVPRLLAEQICDRYE